MKKIFLITLLSLISISVFSQRKINKNKFLVYNNIVDYFYNNGDTIVNDIGISRLDMKISRSGPLKLFFKLLNGEIIMIKYPKYVSGERIEYDNKVFFSSIYFSKKFGYIKICQDSHVNLLFIECGGLNSNLNFPRIIYTYIN